MSFSVEVKEELSKLANLANKEIVKYEFLGYLASNHIQISKRKSKYVLKFSTENEYNINRFSKLLNNLNITKYEIEMVGKTFVITVYAPELEEITYNEESIIFNIEIIKEKIYNKEALEKAFVRGCFLGSGLMNNPEKTYHLEIVFLELDILNFVLDILKNYDIKLKYIPKVQGHGIYSRNGEEISKFLAFIGANTSVLRFEDARVYRDIKNNVNRKVNCETANLNKTINSAIKQIEAIKYLQKVDKLKDLSEGLQEIAFLRIEHPEATLTELGTMLKNPIGKSGVNHRLKAIEEIAEELKR